MSTTPIDQYTDVRRLFQQQLDVFEQSLNGSKERPLHQFRRAAMKRLDTLSFPTRRDEEWKYTPITRLLKPSYADGPGIQASEPVWQKELNFQDAVHIAVTNGIAKIPAGLEKGLSILNIEDAFNDGRFKPMIQRWMSHWSTEETDPFIVLNAALSRGGLFVHVESNCIINKPLHFHHFAAPIEDPISMHPQLFVLAGNNSELTIIESFSRDAKNRNLATLQNVVNRLKLGQNAKIRHIKIQNEGEEGFHINNTRAEQERDSVYSHYTAEIGGRIVRNNLHAIHQRQGVHTDFYGMSLASGQQHIDNHTFIDHAIPNCTSNELYKNIITESGTGVFNGKVIVRQDAQKTNAYQQNSNLVLSDKAVMDSKPQLEIFADDVTCSHGATIGQLDETAVFYLRSRGLSEKAARQLLQFAFLGEVIANIPIEFSRNAIENLVSRKMN